MKTILALTVMVFVGFGLVGRSSGDVAPAPLPMVSTNEGGCWDKCKTCEEKCRDQSGDAKRSCDDACWKTNDTCCGGVGGKGVYKMCGCTDK
jgi:hypothetical protein